MMAAAAVSWLGAAALHAAGLVGVATLPLDTPPARLSQTGLYVDAAALVVDPRNRPFTPQYPLWSDGAGKRRWVRLPDGATIDARDINRWDFPVGTRFWKEFTFGDRRVETRMLWKTAADRWAFAAYAWDDEQRDAVLVPATGQPDVIEIAPGKWHSIPSEAECRACHDSTRTEVLGFTALQLSDDRDPLALHAEPPSGDMVTLRHLVADRRLSGAPVDLVARSPRVAGRTPVERAVLGYLSTNCGSCHNRESSVASLGLFLEYDTSSAPTCAPDAITTTLDRPGHWVVQDAPPGTSRVIAPGDRGRSALYRRAASRRPSSQMPPIGTVVADRDALTLIARWIDELAVTDPGRAVTR